MLAALALPPTEWALATRGVPWYDVPDVCAGWDPGIATRHPEDEEGGGHWEGEGLQVGCTACTELGMWIDPDRSKLDRCLHPPYPTPSKTRHIHSNPSKHHPRACCTRGARDGVLQVSILTPMGAHSGACTICGTTALPIPACMGGRGGWWVRGKLSSG